MLSWKWPNCENTAISIRFQVWYVLWNTTYFLWSYKTTSSEQIVNNKWIPKRLNSYTLHVMKLSSIDPPVKTHAILRLKVILGNTKTLTLTLQLYLKTSYLKALFQTHEIYKHINLFILHKWNRSICSPQEGHVFRGLAQGKHDLRGISKFHT